MQIDEYPVNVPISSARLAPTTRVSSVEQCALRRRHLHDRPVAGDLTGALDELR